ncbi:hypothetical protein [Glycomyces xiaoerkulensis]|uniref:hypothetical protein n=1 Tax=Glycomyces xiaoerkulensis TaxID=2038139 RepID=UPI0018E47285|nr:hypothetical protein [Glycomyces xiaoerkulensis]
MSDATRTSRFLSGIGTWDMALTLLLITCYPVMLVAAIIPSAPVFIGAVAVSLVVDLSLLRGQSSVAGHLRQFRFGVSNRVAVRQLLVISLLARLAATGEIGFGPVVLAAVASVAFYGLQAVHGGLVAVVRKTRRLPISTKNIDLSGMKISDAPPAVLLNRAGDKILHMDLPLIAGLLATAATGRASFGVAGTVATMILAVGYVLVTSLWLRPSKWVPKEERTLDWFDRWLREYAPTTILYFSGSKESTYQLNMWLEPLERLDGERPLVIMREQHTFPGLQHTSLPVVCVPSAVHLMNMDLSTVRVAMYPAHVGKNLHLLRVPTMKHVFLGHGDSDKVASVNPFGKAYDQLWTAGEAGRERWERADVGVRDDAIVSVGRPQLHSIRTAAPDAEIPTILYAPTWEGWTDEPGNTSLVEVGEAIVAALLRTDPPIRLVYKPHPFTGIRSKAARTANDRIVEMIEAANRRRGHESGADTDSTGVRRAQAAQSQASRVDAAFSRDDMTSTAEVEANRRAAAKRDADFWSSRPTGGHVVITGAEPTVYDCFNQAHALIADVSSVVTDFIASGKPYAIADSAGLGEAVFKRDNTAARAAFILDRDGGGLESLLAAVRDHEADPLREDRDALKRYLLGPDVPPSQERFAAAVRDLAEQAEARNRKQQLAAEESVSR